MTKQQRLSKVAIVIEACLASITRKFETKAQILGMRFASEAAAVLAT